MLPVDNVYRPLASKVRRTGIDRFIRYLYLYYCYRPRQAIRENSS